jgi:hypothetical protein
MQMDDTSPDIKKKVHEMMQLKSPMERLQMGFSMNETSRYLVARSILENNLIYSAADLRKELFLKFYGSDFDPAMRQKILDHIGSTSIGLNGDSYHFDHIPNGEKELEWWKGLFPLIQARLLREKPENSRLLKILNRDYGMRTWRNVKKLIETTLAQVENGKRILARKSEIKGSSDPDGIIDDMFGELRTVPYLLLKGFKNISYSRQKGLDFKAEFEGQVFHIESTYVHGPDFKTQEYLFTSNSKTSLPFYKIRPDKLIRLLEGTYSRKKEQVMRYGETIHNALIFMVTDLEETYAPWLEHPQIQEVHPLVSFVLSCEVPTVIFGCGSVYEPHSNSFNQFFGKLQSFDWPSFASHYLGTISLEGYCS